MAPNPRVVNAFRAMKAIGIREDKVKPVLKRLLKLYDKNWELIEEENYRVLADAIFDDDDESKGENCGEEPEVHDEPERPLKRLRKGDHEGQSSAPANNGIPTTDGPLTEPKSEKEAVATTNRLPDVRNSQESVSPANHSALSPRAQRSYKGKEPMLPQVASKGKRPIVEKPSHALRIRDAEADNDKQKMPESYALIKPKDEPFTDDFPPNPLPATRRDSSVKSLSTGKQDDCEAPLSHSGAKEGGKGPLVPSSEKKNKSALAAVQNESPTNIEIASSSLGEDKLMNVPSVDELKKSAACSALGNGSADIGSSAKVSAGQIAGQLESFGDDTHTNTNGSVEAEKKHELGDPRSQSLVVVPQHLLTSAEIRSDHDFDDIARGMELVEISCTNEINNECPSPFNYISENLIFQNANVKFTLSRVKAEDCCSTCIGDCLFSKIVCVCASETGGKYTYTSEGNLKEDFLDDCISMTRDPQRQSLFFCKACPLERSKNEDILEPCKGHMKRNFIKECWSKCACHKLCGNRVVQRGLVSRFEVFFTREGKGWGLRTLDKLPKGAFVCEYVGEILTIKELHERNMQRARGTSSDQYTHPVFLDAFWCLKKAMKDDEALCLDATLYGNVARFINHRCLDANLIEIPVKIETPDHHYYRLALFTTREIEAMEELTWDYGIDFDDNDHPVEAFRCLCGSKFCRNMKRSNRSKLTSR